jgi:hypothetical protein
MADPKQITLDKSEPAVAEAFEGCKPGDTYRVVSDDDSTIVLAVMDGGAEGGEETTEEQPAGEEPAGDMTTDETEPVGGGTSSGNPAVDRLMRNKSKS